MSGWRGKLWLLPAGALAVLLNVALLAGAAHLSRDRLFVTDMTEPVGVNLITLEPATPPPPPPPQERKMPPPEPESRPDFTPELAPPSLGRPDPLALTVKLDPALFVAGPPRGAFVFNATDLDTPPTALLRPNPLYPYRARQRGIEGSVEIKFLVGADGRISEVQVLHSEPAGVFDAEVLKTVPQWRFRAGVLDGETVPSWVVTTVLFSLNN